MTPAAEPTSQALPPLYAKWMGSWLAAPIPEEKNATCQQCAMCPPTDVPASIADAFYSPVTKCCTYVPELANYLVGRALSDDRESAAGRATVEHRMRQRVGVTPLGLARSRLYRLVYQHSHDAFGSAVALRCPHHLADGRCGVWRHRESTCATWFCKHDRGQLGKMFWQRLHALLHAAELALSRHCLLELAFPVSSLEALTSSGGDAPHASLDTEDLDGQVDPKWYGAIWGPYEGRESELYRQCERLVDPLTFRDVLAIGGAELSLMSELVRSAHARLLSDAPPARPRHRQLRVIYATPTTAKVVTYSNTDPLSVPRRLLDVLHRFDGRPTAEALAIIEAEDNLRLTPGVVRKLGDFGIVADDADSQVQPTVPPQGGQP